MFLGNAFLKTAMNFEQKPNFFHYADSTLYRERRGHHPQILGSFSELGKCDGIILMLSTCELSIVIARVERILLKQ